MLYNWSQHHCYHSFQQREYVLYASKRVSLHVKGFKMSVSSKRNLTFTICHIIYPIHFMDGPEYITILASMRQVLI